MAIEFHCSKCGKLIRAPGNAGGQRGKCPYCKESVYIPTPLEEMDEIPLAPLNGDAEERDRRLREEALRLSAALDRDEPGKYETGEPPSTGGDGAPPLPRDLAVDVPDLVTEYLLAMSESDMSRADRAVRQLESQVAQAKDHVQRLMVDNLPPTELGDVPEPVYKGFLRALLEQLP